MLVLNDLHAGVKRVAGTTQKSAEQLRNYLVANLAEMLRQTPHSSVLVNGDMFDSYNIPLGDLFSIYSVCAEYLDGAEGRVMHLLPGNHCLSKSSTDLSSFELMARLLSVRFPGRAVYLEGGGWVDRGRGIYGISHVVNQAQFDLELSRVPREARFLALHCNFDSPFAEHADHSLNIKLEQAKAFAERGVTLILGHEHHQRVLLGGKVIITGNQFPSSIADCVTPDGREVREKQCAVITDEGVKLHTCWRADDEVGFHQVSIDDRLDPEMLGFVRVVGEVEPENAAEVLRKISRLRQASNAFVITNSVRVKHAGGSEIEDVLEGVEDARGIDVLEMLMEILTLDQQEAVRAVLAIRE